MKQELLIAEFLEELQYRADERFKGRLDQSFVSWYVEAEFGDVQWQFTDGPNDSGIDAIVWCDNDDPSVVILQSKFSEKIGENRLGANCYDEFDSVVRGFRYGNDHFEEILNGAADELRKPYRKAQERLGASSTWATRKKAFKLITTNTRSPAKEFNSIPPDGFVYSDYLIDLYKGYRLKYTPEAKPLKLAIQDKLPYHHSERGTTSYLFNARVSDFRKYFEKNDVGRLVARNIRFNLGKKVGKGIRDTYEKNPKDFWYMHNGLTIVCARYSEENQIATLEKPSVVNGAQTLYAIESSTLGERPAYVITRVIVRATGDDDKWVQRIIGGVNTQNRVENYAFRSNDAQQVEVQRKFKEQHVFYERKQGEWREVRTNPKYKGHSRLSLKKLGQILTAVSDEHGQGVLDVKRGTDAIFEDKSYDRIFTSVSTIAFRFKRIYFAYRLFRLLNMIGLDRKRQHSFWNALWVIHQVLFPAFQKSNFSVEQVRAVFDEFESTGIRGIRARRAAKLVTEAVWVAFRVGRKNDLERWTPNNFFKQKYGNEVIEKIAVPRAKKAVGVLAKCFLAPNRG